MNQAEDALRANWKRCAESFDFFTEYMIEIHLQGYAEGQRGGLEDAAEECEGTHLIWDPKDWRNLTKQQLVDGTAKYLADLIRRLSKSVKP